MGGFSEMKNAAQLAIIAAALGIDINELIDREARRANNGHSKYRPHQGNKERQRRLKKMELPK
jgi:hypothetical protein